ncbi:MFS general substrate transporter [Bimuria novae-zelandiae CBS 107.79]|uniref:MFS general substrate transporter n=1 Tax=Bimuria novae-zelandiae CBS 107.79 TaxID=1447943 RepID=A0A6A5VP71_9PLEO|nr:MFS general substrate transporter [Bimuria novae-zelandiae CBS 107.79]
MADQNNKDKDKATVILDATNTASAAPPGDGEVWSVWSTRGKKAIIFSASFASLLAPLSSNIYFPALEPIAKDLNVSNTLVNLSISTYIILQGIAPTFSAQLSDTGGRRPVYLVCLILFLAANIGLGAQNSYAALLTLRCFQSAGSSGIAALSGAIAADIATPAERGTYVSFASALPMLATAIGPVIGGLMAQYAGWHSIFWLLTAMTGAVFIPIALFFPETCRKVVGNGSVPPQKWNRCWTNTWYERRAISQGKEIASAQRAELAKSRKTTFPNPLAPVMLLLQKECGFALLYSSILACSFYAVLALIPSQFSRIYDFNELQVSLCYIPFGVGALVAAFIRGRYIDGNFHRHAKRLGVIIEKNKRTDLTGFPIERARLEVAVPTIVLTTGCGIGFGWMLEKEVHLSGPLIMLFCVGFCASASLNCIATLLIDIYPGRAGTVAAANNLLRCMLGAGATAATVPLINGVGIGWALTIFGLLNTVFMPILWYIMKEGPKWRAQRAAGEQRKNAPGAQKKS